MSQEGVRKKLRPKRFNKFESDIVNNSESVSKRVQKRPNTESGCYSNSKKKCYGLMHPPSTTINLANNRMKKLKQNLQEDLNIETNNKITSVSPENRFKNVLNKSGNPKFSDSSGSNLPTFNPNQFPIKSGSSLSCRILKIKENTESISSRNNLSFDVEKSTSISQRLKLKRNLSKSCLDISKNLIDTQLKSTERLSLKRKCDNPLNFKEPKPILTQESLSVLNNPKKPTDTITECVSVDTFNEKMAMTASWIRNHQQFTDVLPTNNPNITSHNSNVEEKSNLDTSEEMEWTNAEPDTEILKLEKKPENETIKSNTEITTNQETNLVETGTVEKDQKLCIVIDTNIFISELSKLSDILMLKISGTIQPLLYIPWMVITELDEIKDRPGDKKLKQKAFDAIKFINKNLTDENQRVKGQTVSDMNRQKHIGSSPDDKIIGCCLQAVDTYESVILLSNDVNLKNKALINNITAASANEIMIKIMSKSLKTTKFQKIVQKMSILCSEIICECAKEAYGDVWSKMDMLCHPPWSLLECLKRFKKYWIAVFQEKVMKQFLSSVDKLQLLMTNNKGNKQ